MNIKENFLLLGSVMMKCKFFLLLVLLFFTTSNCFAETISTPKRIAILPVLNQSVPNPEVENYLISELTKKLRIPLNDILHAHEYISEEEIKAILPELQAQSTNPATFKIAADKLSADLMIGIVITNAHERQYQNLWNGETYLSSNISLRLIGYDRETDTIFNSKKSTSYNGTYMLVGRLQPLAKSTLDKLLSSYHFKKF